MSRNIIANEGGQPFSVTQHIITKNMWEFYLGPTNSYDIAHGYVMGMENEWGDVYLPEIKDYVVITTTGSDLYDELQPPVGYKWEDEQTHYAG